jgi:F-type H+-transporting ATPase subunit b
MEEPLLASPEFWVAVAFVIFVAGVFRPAKRAVVSALDARAARIKTDLDEASRLHEEAKALLAAYERKQREAIKESADMIAQAKREAEGFRKKFAADLAASLSRREKMAQDRIAQAESDALRQVRFAAVDIAAAAIRELLVKHLDERKAGQLIDQALAELPTRFH